MSSVYSKLTVKQKADRYAYLIKWRKARVKPFVSILDKEIIPPVKAYKKREKKAESQADDTVSEMDFDENADDDADADADDNQSVISEMTDCSLINTPYHKTTHLKQLDTRLKDCLFSKGFDSQEKISGVFNTLRNVNPKYGLPVLEQRSERRLTEFYNSTIENLQ